MKVALVTILDNINLGTVLQAYATADAIERVGHEVVFINYVRPSETVRYKLKEKLSRRGSWLRRMIDAGVSCTVVPWVKRRLKRDIRYRFAMTRRYNSCEQLRIHPVDADIFMTGSDQVWNCSYNAGVDEVFFLGFTDKPKVAYAASVGTDCFPREDVKEVIGFLREYSHITVRETATCDYIRSLGFVVKSVLDPTLLLTKAEWMSRLSIPGSRIIAEPYLLVYSVESERNDFIFEQAWSIARQRGLRLVAMTASNAGPLKRYNADRLFAFADVRQFLRLMRDADFVVASSFHGTAFSINFNKEFVTVTPPRFNVRMESIIDKFGLRGRVITDTIVDPASLPSLNYDAINEIMTSCRRQSFDLLSKMLI